MLRTHRFIIQTLILLSVLANLYSQEKIEPKEWFVEAESYFLFEEYKDALPLYMRILRVEPENYNVQYKVGICYLNDIFQYPKSVEYLEAATNNINPNYKYDNYKEKNAPPEAQYYLGRAYHAIEDLNKAIESYNSFLNTADPEEFDLDLVKSDIEACQRAKEFYKLPVYVTYQNLGSNINSRFEDVNPVLSGDGQVIAFTRKLKFYDGVFISVKDENGIWSPPQNLTSEFQMDGNTYTTGISYFGDEIFVYRSDDYDGNIYSSKRISNNWSPLEKLNENINTKYWESHASPSPDGQTLIFTSNREGGYGGLDIYKSKRSTSGEWGPAVNMGPAINSPSNEETPFFCDEGHTLVFSSQGHNTMGGYDIFLSALENDGTWGQPKNMGYPLNSTIDNIFFHPLDNASRGIYSTYQGGNTEGLLDIYEVEVFNEYLPRIFTIEGKINIEGAAENDSPKVTVSLLKASTRELAESQRISEAENFSLRAEQGEYILVVEGEGLETYQQDISIKINQPSILLALPAIEITKADDQTIPAQPYLVNTAPVKSTIQVKKNYYAVADSGAIPIELILTKGADLDIVVLVEDTLLKKDNIPDVRKRFTYFYKPYVGENTIEFTATDPDGYVSTTEVVINYRKPEKTDVLPGDEQLAGSSALSPIDNTGILLIATGALQDYIALNDLSAHADLHSLYNHLITESENNAFTSDEVNELFATYFVQSDIDNFNRNLSSVDPKYADLIAQVPDSLVLPVQHIDYYDNMALIPIAELNNALFSIYARNKETGSETYLKLISFTKNPDYSTEINRDMSVEDAWNQYLLAAGEQANNGLRIAASSDEIEFFHQNLMVSSSGNLNEFLVAINLEGEGLHNAIDLASYLISNASAETYSTEELFEAIELARRNRKYNISRFHELLTNEAEGTLKSELVALGNQLDDKDEYSDLLNYLLNQSKHKGYTRENVYDLLVNLAGIYNVDEFAEKLISYGYSQINNAIADTSLNHFSNPLELIQYLVVATQSYDFTASDINNLLIRMILEKGLDERSGSYYKDEMKQSIWKSRRFIIAVILVNIVLLIMIILFSFRRKKDNT